MKRLVFLVLVALLTVGGACAPRQPSGSPLLDHIDTDFAALEAPAYRQVARTLAEATGLELDDDASDRSVGPRQVIDLGDGATALVAVAPGAQLQLARVAADGDVDWRRTASFGEGFSVGELRAFEHGRPAVPMLAVHLRGRGGERQRLVWALTDDDACLVRVDDGRGTLLLTQLEQDHSDLEYPRGALDAEAVPAQLAALVRLAAPSRVAERGRPAVLSHLEKLAQSTDLWVAQQAAEVLTLPREQ
ncbi:MAG: hypothetical protein ACOCYP_03950 [Planctomycetota bacterium]